MAAAVRQIELEDIAPARLTPRLAGLSVVLPCFNEVENVGEAISQTRRAARRVAGVYEVIVVDDGSTDGTGAAVEAIARRDPAVRLATHPDNLGYGAALRTGIAAARQPWILLTDADLQFDLDELDRLAACSATHDVIVGRRVQRRDPLHRRVNAAAWNALVNAVFKLPVHDVDCAFKLARTDLLQSLELRSRGAAISPELLLKSLAAGAAITELEVRHMPRRAGRQSGARLHVILSALRELALLGIRQ
jgi:glycosyltransferase involved in cell wall biosynthesis